MTRKEVCTFPVQMSIFFFNIFGPWLVESVDVEPVDWADSSGITF
jgi:hypothetical protein